MNNVVVNVDTDSFMIAKPDGSEWSPEEIKSFIVYINSGFPDLIRWEDDGYYKSVVVVGSKNYALLEHGKDKIKIKGSGMRDSKKEPAMREMMNEVIDALIYGKPETVLNIYLRYVKEALNVQDISRWSQKKSLSASVLACKGYVEQDILDKKLRRNETVVWDALINEEGLQQGDKFYIYPVILETKVIAGRLGKSGKPLKDKVEIVTGLKLTKYWKQDHDVEKLVERCYKTIAIFEKVLDMTLILDYTKGLNAKLLEGLK